MASTPRVKERTGLYSFQRQAHKPSSTCPCSPVSLLPLVPTGMMSILLSQARPPCPAAHPCLGSHRALWSSHFIYLASSSQLAPFNLPTHLSYPLKKKKIPNQPSPAIVLTFPFPLLVNFCKELSLTAFFISHLPLSLSTPSLASAPVTHELIQQV